MTVPSTTQGLRTTRAAIESISRSSTPHADNRPNMRGALMVEQDLKAGTRLWLAPWSKQISGADFILISAEVAVGGPRKRSTTDSVPRWKTAPHRKGRLCGKSEK